MFPLVLVVCYIYSNATQSSEVHASCRVEATGEYAYALGADQRCFCTVSHHRSHHLCQWDTMGCWTHLHCTVGVSVDRLRATCACSVSLCLCTCISSSSWDYRYLHVHVRLLYSCLLRKIYLYICTCICVLMSLSCRLECFPFGLGMVL